MVCIVKMYLLLCGRQALSECVDNSAASVARHLYIRSPCGVKGLMKIYGGRQNNGTCPSHFCAGSSSVARKALQALEHLKIVEKDANGYGSVIAVY